MKIITVLLVLLLFSCSKQPPVLFDVNVKIHYIDNSSRELFTNGINGYVAKDVRLYSIKNNVRQLIYTNATGSYIPDYPYGYNIDSITGKKYFVIFSNVNIVNDTSLIIINLKPNVEDTLKCSFTYPNSNPSSIKCDKVWYNGVLQTSNSFDIAK
jgi:hypothetical protein